MDTELLPGEAPGAIARAVELLAAGQVVALPTETVYGLAADATHAEGVARIFEAKQRPASDPLIVHLPGEEWIERIAAPSRESAELVSRLVRAFWPGPLTLILPRRAGAVPDAVTAGSDLVAVRMSAHPVFAAVGAAFGRPLAAPSANRFGRISPTQAKHVLAELGGRIPLILDGGPAAHGVESTIVVPGALGDRLRILRHGPVTDEMLAAFGRVESSPKGSKEAAAAPGQMAGHYAPRTPLHFLGSCAPDPARWGLLAFRRDQPPNGPAFAQTEYLCETGDLAEAAGNLFAALRRLDEARWDGIAAQEVPEHGLGRAIMERLRRAAAGSSGSCGH
jgi:L-threonylcarbamoyladenylate synthase